MPTNGLPSEVIDQFRLLQDDTARFYKHEVEQISKATNEKLDAFGVQLREFKERGSRPPFPLGGNADTPEGLGSLVTRSAQFQGFQSGGAKGRVYIPVEKRLITKAILVTDGTGGLRPGVQSLGIAGLPQAPLALADLIPSRTMSEGSATFMRQKTPHPVAGVQVNQGDVKAEGVLDFDPITIAPATLAVWVPASQQALQDVTGLMLLIDTELLYALRVLEEAEVLAGDGTEGHLSGIMPQATAHTAVAGDSAIDTVAKAIGALAAAGVRATGVVLNPADWLTMTLARTTVGGEYLLGSPAMQTPQVLWGTPLAFSTAMPSGQYLTGDFQRGSELLYRLGASVMISTEHADYFTRNLIAIKAEERLALAVKQPSAFRKGALVSGAAAAARK